MANENLGRYGGESKVSNSMAESGNPAFIHLESRVLHLEEDVREIKSGIKTLLDRPQNPGLSNILGTLLSTLAVCGILMGFAEWRLTVATAPMKAEMEISRTSQIKIAILEDRSNRAFTQSNWANKADRTQ